ncbi:uncharacterized protein BDR25DRAFT_4530 [Lindgomyces ingoldianus]|uniref:Uncharacterized protein n=1 Tax=Lindgomyces ingoldianus TaxID=673940 RepID=A0ACB6RFE1_9PLEO|nr:uncharacterized protein BDR25DRAFT_4530 [Lindgomyces ingoldianus]KAF2477851.1 hypothetical protein BDR25DRAFT_4530 [Lindgomyces ingoldianus]
MTDRRASFEGHPGRSRHRSPTSEEKPDGPESLTTSTTIQSPASVPRRRQLRAKSIPNDLPESSPTTWVETDKAEPRKARGSRATQRKASGSNSPRNSASPKSSTTELEHTDKEKDNGGFLPKLTRIPEGNESKTAKSRRSSTSSSVDDPAPVRRPRRPSENVPVVHRLIRQKHGSLRRRAESLGNLPNPSLLSVLSGVTNQSSSSGGSTSTITQKSYDKTHINKRRQTKERKRLQTKRAQTVAQAMDPEPQTPAFFQYIHDGSTSDHFLTSKHGQARPTSSSSSTSISSSSTSSHGIEHNDGASSIAEDRVTESPLTSPASTRRSDREEPRCKDMSSSDSDLSVQENSTQSVLPPISHHAIYHQDEEEEEEEEEEEDDDDDDDDDEEEGDSDEGVEYDVEEADDRHAHQYALERSEPPRLPSASSSRHSDSHTRRLRNQEQELRDHVLQNPQPQRDFQFAGAPSPNPHPAMPLYDAYSHSGASPANFFALAPHPAGWVPPAPPPPAIGYYSPPQVPPAPYPPVADNSYAMASRNPMAAPSTVVQPPPFHHPHAQPPHYQPHPTGPDSTKTTVVGYELLADKLTELSKNDNETTGGGKVIPMYRKFEHLNHRVLLHLQDEISELEEELRYLDECIAQISPRTETGHVYPASRRAEARYGGDLHYRRTDLLGRIYLKLGQYNQALSSFSSAVKNLDAANAEEIQAYRTWMEKHAPIELSETRFLDRKDDLLAISRRRSASNVGGVGPHQSAAIGLPLILVLPLFSFALVPTLLGRLFIIILIGAAEVTVVASTELMGVMTIGEWVTCASM